MDQSEVGILRDIRERLNVLVLLGASGVATSKELTNEEKVRLLTKAGFRSHEIGSLLGMRAGSVRRIRTKKVG